MQLDITPYTAALTVFTTAAALTAIVVLVRLRGLRSFAKMAPHDFATTIATGSILGATATGSVPVVQGVVALCALFAIEWMLGRWRAHGGEKVLDNSPVLLMVGTTMLHDQMESVGVTESDIRAKLREANVVRYDEVLAVVFEGTGDVSVLHGDQEQQHLDHDLLRDVRGVPSRDAWPPSWQGTGTLGT